MEILYAQDLWNVIEKGCKLIQSNCETEKGVRTSAKNEVLESKVRLKKNYNSKVIIFNSKYINYICDPRIKKCYHNKRFVGYACTNVLLV